MHLQARACADKGGRVSVLPEPDWSRISEPKWNRSQARVEKTRGLNGVLSAHRRLSDVYHFPCSSKEHHSRSVECNHRHESGHQHSGANRCRISWKSVAPTRQIPTSFSEN